MNVEEITKKLEEIRADAFERASSHDEQSKTQLEDYNRVELDEDVAGEDVKLERTKGKDFPTPKTLSRTTSMDGGKGPKEDIYVNDSTLKAPSINELQSKLDDLKKENFEGYPQDNSTLSTTSAVQIQIEFTHNAGENYYEDSNIVTEIMNAIKEDNELAQIGVKFLNIGSKKIK